MQHLWYQRQQYSIDATIGRFFVVDGASITAEWWGVEDAIMPDGVKIKGETAIPIGEYSVILSMSPRLKRITPEILHVPMFAGIRIHALNSAGESLGCIGPGMSADIAHFRTIEARKAENKITDLIRSWGGSTTIKID